MLKTYIITNEQTADAAIVTFHANFPNCNITDLFFWNTNGVQYLSVFYEEE